MENIRTIWKRYLKSRQIRRVATVRYMFPLVFGMVAILGATAITGFNSSYIKLTPSETLVENGETFSIAVFASAHVPVNAVDIEIAFSSKDVEIISVDKGQSVLTIWKEDPIIGKNSIKISGGTFRRGFIGEHLVATIKVKAKYNGQTEFLVSNVRLLAGDGKGTKVAVSESDPNSRTSFYIYDQNQDPAKISAEITVRINEDINGDGRITLADISAFLSAWHNKSTTYDFNDDKKMNFSDFSIILAKSFFN
jgi:hypothetical protein